MSSAKSWRSIGGDTTSSSVDTYVFYKMGPVMLPWGTEKDNDFFVEYSFATITLHDLGERWFENHSSATPSILNLLFSTSVKIWWSAVSKAALILMATIAVILWFSIFHRQSFTILIRAVSQLKFFLYAIWYLGIRLCLLQCWSNWLSTQCSWTLLRTGSCWQDGNFEGLGQGQSSQIVV